MPTPLTNIKSYFRSFLVEDIRSTEYPGSSWPRAENRNKGLAVAQTADEAHKRRLATAYTVM